jgi:putative two-component system response regulator
MWTASGSWHNSQRNCQIGTCRFWFSPPTSPSRLNNEHSLPALLRIKNLLYTKKLYEELQQHNRTLEEKVRERTQRLAEAQLEIVDRLALAAEYRDDATGQHTQRVGKLSAMIAQGLGQSESEVELLRVAATLHDVGKIGIPDQILLKPGRLSNEEFDLIKSHTTIGGTILGDSRFALLQMAREITLSHHERWDGTGYPFGLQGEAIHLSGRIVTIADVFDALTHDRPYKKAWTLEEAVAEIKKLSGRQFDPNLVDVFLSLINTQGLRQLSMTIEASDNRVIVPTLQF